MKHCKLKSISLILLYIVAFSSCKKYLAAKPDQSLALPETLNDLQLLLDDYDFMNSGYPTMGEISADNYYLSDESWGSTRETEQNYYIWQPFDDNAGDYFWPNKIVTTANLVLESVKTIKVNTEKERFQAKSIEGSAYFFRAFAYWILAQNFCTVFHKASANRDLGLPIRTTSTVLGNFSRSTVEQTYRQIIDDLQTAIPLLPDKIDIKYRVDRAAAYGLMSRVYISMRNYEKAGAYADSCLEIYNLLMDYNDDPAINTNSQTVTFNKWNTEVIFDAESITGKALSRTMAIVDTTLYSMYDSNDLRKDLFFQSNVPKKGYYFKGHYTGLSSSAMFYGIATDEVLLNRAECAARINNTVQAKTDINSLLRTRWKEGTYQPIAINDKDSLLQLILDERRKELLFRGLRWTDLRRLNEEPGRQKTLNRTLGGKHYQLLPGDNRYVFLFPHQSVELSGIEQNP